MPDLLMDLVIALSEETYRKVMVIDVNPMLLKLTDIKQKDIFELLHRRRKKASTIFCSQYVFEEWYNQPGGQDKSLQE